MSVPHLDYSIFQSQQDSASHKSAALENEARRATQTITYTTTGTGFLVVQTPILFGVRFLEEPLFTSGMRLVKAPNQALYRLPLVTAGVTEWQTEPNPTDPKLPFYVGASVYFHVIAVPLDTADGSTNAQMVAAPPNVVVDHHLRFEAVGMKVLPSTVIDQLTSGAPLDTLAPGYGSAAS